MKLKVIASLIVASSVFLTGCFEKTFEDGTAALREGNVLEAKKIWTELAQTKSDDNAMYSLYSLYDTNPEVMPFDESLGWLQLAADAGRPDAQYEYGLFLAQHDRFNQAYTYLENAATWKEERALRFLEQYHEIKEIQIGAENNDPNSMYLYGKWLMNNKDPKKIEEGMTWARKSAMAGNSDGQTLYGTVLYEKQDYTNASAWLEKAANQGNHTAEYYLGIMTIHGLGSLRNAVKGLSYLKKSAEANNPLANYELGRMYLEGDKDANIREDFKLAVDYIGKAAAENMLEAQYTLATIYENGIGVPRDYTRALTLYRLAAEHDHIRSQSKLGELYIKNGSNEEERAEGVKWLEKAIQEHDSAEAKTFLAYAYSHGLGVKKNYDEAYRWYKEAADVDVALAQFNLAVMIMNGHGANREVERAVYWLEQAAHGNLPIACVALALIYDSVDKDERRYSFWRSKSLSLGLSTKEFDEKLKEMRQLFNIK